MRKTFVAASAAISLNLLTAAAILGDRNKQKDRDEHKEKDKKQKKSEKVKESKTERVRE